MAQWIKIYGNLYNLDEYVKVTAPEIYDSGNNKWKFRLISKYINGDNQSFTGDEDVVKKEYKKVENLLINHYKFVK